MYLRPSHDTRSFSLHRCDDYPPTVCSFETGTSLASHMEVPVPVSKEAQLLQLFAYYIMFFHSPMARVE